MINPRRRDRPMLFSAPMIRAIDAGRKSQTRRWLKPKGLYETHPSGKLVPIPRYNLGDLLWVREAWAVSTIYDGMPPRELPVRGCKVNYAANGDVKGCKVRHARFMMRWMSRFTLAVTEVRVERLQDISEADAIAEGAPQLVMDDDGAFFESDCGTHRCGFAGLWNHINAKRPGASWDDNPWVVAITFETHRCNIDDMPAETARECN